MWTICRQAQLCAWTICSLWYPTLWLPLQHAREWLLSPGAWICHLLSWGIISAPIAKHRIVLSFKRHCGSQQKYRQTERIFTQRVVGIWNSLRGDGYMEGTARGGYVRVCSFRLWKPTLCCYRWSTMPHECQTYSAFISFAMCVVPHNMMVAAISLRLGCWCQCAVITSTKAIMDGCTSITHWWSIDGNAVGCRWWSLPQNTKSLRNSVD